MSKWEYNGYAEAKNGMEKHTKTIKYRMYLCPMCEREIKIEHLVKPPRICPNCGADMREEGINDEKSIFD